MWLMTTLLNNEALNTHFFLFLLKCLFHTHVQECVDYLLVLDKRRYFSVTSLKVMGSEKTEPVNDVH